MDVATYKNLNLKIFLTKILIRSYMVVCRTFLRKPFFMLLISEWTFPVTKGMCFLSDQNWLKRN